MTFEPADPAWWEFPTIAKGDDDVLACTPSDKLIKTLQERGTLTLVVSNI